MGLLCQPLRVTVVTLSTLPLPQAVRERITNSKLTHFKKILFIPLTDTKACLESGFPVKRVAMYPEIVTRLAD